MRLVDGKILFLVSLLTGCASLGVNSCKEKGPKIEICILNGDGSAECILQSNEEVTKVKEELENYIATNPGDYEKLIKFCFDRGNN